ncbi:hypothetical protein CY34DRAFT_17368 [Suillus luteus UH-Slu-Lm8-n1]|uniref:Peptidase A1 domain-containing protein n=1 Tax=Suillus luteus UH-Slu-Lm8-n1 TaxID=930992 RepID=A0A0C9ZZI8_9AGAM|nr:hypothetical protein CY34DRAFT_17368 [Suillus luteus UH-Slu-Lm8-n1]
MSHAKGCTFHLISVLEGWTNWEVGFKIPEPRFLSSDALASRWYQPVSYGTSHTILNTTAGIVDTGTALLLLATEAFQAYQKATGAIQDQLTI